MLNPRISAWEFFQGPFDFNKTPLGPVGCRVLIHAKPATRRSWDFWAKNGFYIGPALDSYRCFKLVNADTKSQVISDTVEFRHSYLSVPAPSPEDKIIHGLQVVASSLTGASPPTSISQVEAITNLRDIFESWRLLVPPSFQPPRPRIPMSGRPRVPTQDPPRVVLPSLPTPAHPTVWLAHRGVHRLDQQALRSYHLLRSKHLSTLHPDASTLPAPLLQGWGFHLKYHCLAPRGVRLHQSPLPIAPAPGCRHRPHLRSSPQEGLSTSVSPTRCPRPKPLDPPLSQSALQASVGPCQLQRFRDLPVSARHYPC
jgi:hypothetical protein